MIQKITNVVVIYHQDCLDGFGAAWAAWNQFGDKATYIGAYPGQPIPQGIPVGSDVYMLDISYPWAVLQPFSLQMSEVRIIDHHATAYEEYKDFLNANGEGIRGNVFLSIRQDYSAAVLAWMILNHPKPVPQILYHVQDRDLWQWKLEGSKEVLLAIDADPYTFQNMNAWANNLPGLRKAGELLLKYNEQMIALQLKKAHWMRLRVGKDVYVVPAANCSIRLVTSEVGNRLLQMFPEAPFSVGYRADSQGEWDFSLRSRGDFDVSELAKKFHGGGHKAAAGMHLERLPEIGELHEVS